MTKLEYAEEVCKYINAKGYETIINKDSRNNASCVGITVKFESDANISPVFNISGMETESPEEFADYILTFKQPQEMNVEGVTAIMRSKEEILKRCSYILVNTELNRSRTTLLRRPINNTLELQYKIDISDIIPDAKVAIENKHLESLGISKEELYNQAYTNTMEKYPYKIQRIDEVIPIGFVEGELPLYVLSNTKNIYGAGTILYSGMKEVLEKTVGEFIAIPSSIHEWIIIPTSLGEKESLAAMIQDVNNSVVSPEEVLSDRPYELVSDGALLEA